MGRRGGGGRRKQKQNNPTTPIYLHIAPYPLTGISATSGPKESIPTITPVLLYLHDLADQRFASCTTAHRSRRSLSVYAASHIECIWTGNLRSGRAVGAISWVETAGHQSRLFPHARGWHGWVWSLGLRGGGKMGFWRRLCGIDAWDPSGRRETGHLSAFRISMEMIALWSVGHDKDEAV